MYNDPSPAATLGQLFQPLALAILVYCIICMIKLGHRLTAFPAHGVVGPKSPSFIWGSFKEVLKETPGKLFVQWTETYGQTLSFYGMFGQSILLTIDPVAVKHIIMHIDIYHRPEMTRNTVGRGVGTGSLFFVEGDIHRKQRKVMNPAFFPARIRDLTSTFFDKAAQLCEMWSTKILASQDGTAQIDANPWLSRLTLDVIGLAGFKTDFDTLKLQNETTDLSKAIHVLLDLGNAIDPVTLIRASYPILRLLPSPSDKRIREASRLVRRMASELVTSTRNLLLQESTESTDAALDQHRDLLSLLVKESWATKNVDERMSDDEILSQVPTFLIAGHDSTAASIGWVLFTLSTHLDIQKKLRAEISSLGTNCPTMDQLNTLSYLDAVVRETLRLYPAATAVPKVAVADDVIPLGRPIVGRNGEVMTEIRIQKGQMVQIPIIVMNKEKAFWGDDAEEFRPERWSSLPDTTAQLPGVWGNLMTFLGGPRSCIGFRFALTELKAVVFTVIRTFEIELAVPEETITSTSLSAIKRPMYNTGKKLEARLPLHIRQV